MTFLVFGYLLDNLKKLYNLIMTKSFLFFVISFFSVCLFSCSNNNEKTNKITERDSIPEMDSVVTEDKPSPWIGTWTDGNSENATFQIHPDSIYYVDHLDSYKYEMKNDSIKIYYPEYIYSAFVYFRGDTMIFKDTEDENIYYPFRN